MACPSLTVATAARGPKGLLTGAAAISRVLGVSLPPSGRRCQETLEPTAATAKPQWQLQPWTSPLGLHFAQRPLQNLLSSCRRPRFSGEQGQRWQVGARALLAGAVSASITVLLTAGVTTIRPRAEGFSLHAQIPPCSPSSLIRGDSGD